jgi:uncharacterized protein (TIGR02757 family)
MVDCSTKRLLRRLAARYETADFLNGDPSWFMHQVEGDAIREAMAFVASCLSFGSRRQFLPKIQCLLDSADGDVDGWIRCGGFKRKFACGCSDCFYRFFTHGNMHGFLCAYRILLDEYGTLGEYVKREAAGDGRAAVEAICRYFASAGVDAVIPKSAQSACKRVCMFLRWMVRSGSPVDLGLWADSIDRRTLVMPLDTHVIQQSVRLGLMQSATSSMSAARRLTDVLGEVFPDDPLKGDFALFGYGVNAKSRSALDNDR